MSAAIHVCGNLRTRVRGSDSFHEQSKVQVRLALLEILFCNKLCTKNAVPTSRDTSQHMTDRQWNNDSRQRSYCRVMSYVVRQLVVDWLICRKQSVEPWARLIELGVSSLPKITSWTQINTYRGEIKHKKTLCDIYVKAIGHLRWVTVVTCCGWQVDSSV